jgi:F-type H+-transporting ATPase subunit a
MHPHSTQGAPIVVAQGSPEKAAPAGAPVEGAVGSKPEAHNAGEVPNAHLLLWNAGLVIAVMVVFVLAARRRLADIPSGLQNFAEQVVESLNYFTVGTIGPGAERYTPLVGSVFLYVLLMNLIGIIPGLHSPTANITFTLALGVVVFIYVQYEGIRQNGLVGYVKHFMGPMPIMAPLMIPVELISEFVKPFTLAVRLFGNIFGEDVIILVLAGLGVHLLKIPGLPLHFPVLILSLLTDVVQALVFAILTCIYLSLMSHHEHEGPHGEEGPIDGAPSHAAGH